MSQPLVLGVLAKQTDWPRAWPIDVHPAGGCSVPGPSTMSATVFHRVASVPRNRWIRRTTTGCVALLALIAGTVSYLHMHLLVELHGQPGWVAAPTPLSVDG